MERGPVEVVDRALRFYEPGMSEAERVVKALRESGHLEREPVCTCGVARGFTMGYRPCRVHRV
jgi:hypothetical protein